ncbi:MAG: hypothetical protein AB7S94_06775 [Simkaniaceae bacterium]
MSSKRIQGENIQPVPQEPEMEDQKVDPEKFKKVMKVDESDEAQKRHKRNLKREEEEGEDEDVQEKAPPPPSSSFSEFMSDKETLDNVFDTESGGIRRQAAPQSRSAFTAPPPGSISTEGVEVEEPSPTPSASPPEVSPQPQGGQGQQQQQNPASPEPPPQQRQAPSGQPPPTGAPFYEGLAAEQPEKQPTPPSEQQDYTTTESQPTQQVETSPESQQGDEQPPSKKEQPSDTSLLASQPKLSELRVKKKTKKTKPAPEEKIVSSPAKKDEVTPLKKGEEGVLQEGPVEKTGQSPLTGPQKGEESDQTGMEISDSGVPSGATFEMGQEAPLIEGTPLKGASREEGPFRKMSPDEVRRERMQTAKAKAEGQAAIEGVPVSGAEESEGMGKKGEKKEDEGNFLEASELTASITLPLSEMPLSPITPSETTPTYTRLTPEVFELFERMGGVMIIQQSTGVTTTTMTLNMPDSIFNGAEIILNRYSTAPNAFNIQLVGSPEAVKVFQQNITQLEQAFKQANYDFEANILNPILTSSRKSPHQIKRNGAAGDKEGGGGKKQQ